MINENRQIIYHYTTLEGILGIFESGYIRATSIPFLNDRKEFTHIFELIKGECLDSPALKIDTEDIADGIKRLLEELDFNKLFVACFSDHGDNLALWRGYGYYAIGINKSRLSRIVRQQHLYLHKCEYNDEIKKQEIQRAIRRTLMNLPNVPSELRNSRNVFSMILRSFDLWALRFKHRGFESEHELRAFSVPPGTITENAIQTYQKNGEERNFLPLYLRDNDGIVIDEIVFGPDVSEESKDKIRSTASRFGIKILKERNSDIPFRTDIRAIKT